VRASAVWPGPASKYFGPLRGGEEPITCVT
jgi:hypothetical protein